jgi:hypothetical protein
VTLLSLTLEPKALNPYLAFSVNRRTANAERIILLLSRYNRTQHGVLVELAYVCDGHQGARKIAERVSRPVA